MSITSVSSKIAAASLFTIGLAAASWSVAYSEEAEEPSSSLELVDPHVFRVCADPRNLPFSNEAGEGFENKLAELFAKKLDKKVAYAWYPGATGFVRNTLNAHKCDVIMGFPQGNDFAQVTNPYYRTAYALVFKPGNGLDGVDSLDDPSLKTKRIGIVAGTPPATYMAKKGLLAKAKSYPLTIDTRFDFDVPGYDQGSRFRGHRCRDFVGTNRRLLRQERGPEIEHCRTDQGAGWPTARLPHRHGGASKRSGVQAPSQPDDPGEPARDRRNLLSYGLPLLDEKDQPITSAALGKQ